MEILTQILELIMKYGPILGPYLGIMLITYQIMNLFVKPVIRAHKRPDGYYSSNLWRYLRMGMVFYPMILGIGGALQFGLNVGYGLISGAGAQVAFHIIDKIAEKRGIDLVPDEEQQEDAKPNMSKSMFGIPPVPDSLKPRPTKKD